MLTRLLVAFAAAASAFSGCNKNNDNKTVAKNITALAPAQPQTKILITAKGTMYIAKLTGHPTPAKGTMYIAKLTGHGCFGWRLKPSRNRAWT
ncbi:hypothetical protein MAA_10579 [Metarhizium robertsii ARSEF 23]|uniref:Uncharacterized protein n=1 Tax=Metarhizium robertsii (strain ARSEF 23 / ATCC MYA-3075) TaxID=655844 RepID=E9FE80_METRA|nr:uncharacterized protein MAA_10579 [Metarhizium robertsii ARSEF 23]EFY93960.1 hypothetical protein MAA_10579 [Metarhizium robertsii ARSEF 23]